VNAAFHRAVHPIGRVEHSPRDHRQPTEFQDMYAVVSTGGKQYRVEPGTLLSVERLTVEPGASVTFDRVLLVGDGDEVMIGTPIVDGASVSGTVLGEERGPKIVIFKFKQKVKYRRRTGHRQNLTRVRIDRIEAAGRSASVEERAAAPAEQPAVEAAVADAPSAEAVAAKPARTRSRAKAKDAETPVEAEAAAEAQPEAAAEAATPKPRRKRTSTTPANQAEE
jgi:large subunit ribosomal protein L21